MPADIRNFFGGNAGANAPRQEKASGPGENVRTLP
jgi:hypothetical protein